MLKLAILKIPEISTFINTLFKPHPQHISKLHILRYISRGLPLQDGINRFFIFGPTTAYLIGKVDPSQIFFAQRPYYLNDQHPEHTFDNYYEMANPSSQDPHNQILLKWAGAGQSRTPLRPVQVGGDKVACYII